MPGLPETEFKPTPCNHSQNHGLPELSEPVQIKTPQQNPDNNLKVDPVIIPAAGAESASRPATTTTTSTQADTIKHDTKSPILDSLKDKHSQLIEIERLYGTANVEEALQVLKVSEARITKQANIFEAIEQMTKYLQEINSDPIWSDFKKDAAHNFRATKNSIEEARSGIACEKQRILNPLTRSTHKAEEFIESVTGLQWDVKSPRSYSDKGDYIFNADLSYESIKEGYLGKENVIFNITNLTEPDLRIILDKMKSNLSISEWSRTVIIHITDSSKSMTTDNFIKLMKE